MASTASVDTARQSMHDVANLLHDLADHLPEPGVKWAGLTEGLLARHTPAGSGRVLIMASTCEFLGTFFPALGALLLRRHLASPDPEGGTVSTEQTEEF